MASYTLTRPETFPEGATVNAYPETNWPNGIVNQAALPIGTETDSQTVSSGSVTFTGLTDGVRYVAHSTVSSQQRYIGFMVGADTPGDRIARESDNEDITGDWTFTGAVDFTGATVTGIAGFDPDADETVTGDWVFSSAAGLVISGAGGKDTLNLSSATADVGITVRDVNWYWTSANRWKTDDEVLIPLGIYTDFVNSFGAAGVEFTDSIKVEAAGGAGHIRLLEQGSDPAAPAANHAALFAKDNGGGKTQIVARFPTGAVQVIATEP
jgi:hypothetical protein